MSGLQKAGIALAEAWFRWHQAWGSDRAPTQEQSLGEVPVTRNVGHEAERDTESDSTTAGAPSDSENATHCPRTTGST